MSAAAVTRFAKTLQKHGYSPDDAQARAESFYGAVDKVERYGMAFAPAHERQRQRFDAGADVAGGAPPGKPELVISESDKRLFRQLCQRYGIQFTDPDAPAPAMSPLPAAAADPAAQPIVRPMVAPMSQVQMNAALKYQADTGVSWGEAANVIRGMVPRTYSRAELAVRFAAPVGEVATEEQLERVLRYQAQGESWDQAKRAAGIVGGREDENDRQVSEHRRNLQEQRDKRDEIFDLAQSTGCPVAMVFQAAGLAEKNNTSLEDALDDVIARERNKREFAGGEFPLGVSITSLQSR